MPRLPIRRVLVAVGFVAAIILVFRWNGRHRVPVDIDHPGFRMEDVTRTAGIRFVHSRPGFGPVLRNVEPHIAAVGAGVSVADVNRDGWPDLYFTNSAFGKPNALYINQHDGTFEEVGGQAGIADLNEPGAGASMGAVWGDYDNDGNEDLLVYKYGYLQLFHNLGDGTFEDVSVPSGVRRWMNSNGAIWFDYDRDGLLDLYVTAYFRSEVDLWRLKTTKIMHNSFEFATNGGKNILFHNLGNGRFEDVTDNMGGGSTRWTLAAAAADLNGDGWPDLYLANDYGPEEYYLNDHGRRFVLTRAGLETDSKSGMSVALGDVNNRGRLDVFVTNISEKGYLFQNNNLRLNLLTEVGKLENIATGVVADAGWAWGAQIGDLNNDGLNDLFVVNGMISGNRSQDYWYSMSKIAGANRSIFEDARNWPAIGAANLSGYEHSRVLLNLGEAGWADVAAVVGVTDDLDGRAVALADLFNEGVADAIVANQNQPALVYRTRVDPGRHWIGFSLTGTRSNRSAIGALVTLEWAGRSQQRVVDGGMGFASQNDRRIRFGIGGPARIDRVIIRWPSGQVQIIEHPVADRYHLITEPSGDR